MNSRRPCVPLHLAVVSKSSSRCDTLGVRCECVVRAGGWRVQAKTESRVITERLRKREESEEAETGRVDEDKFKRLMQEMQARREDGAALRQLAARYGVPGDAVAQLARYVSVPSVHNAVVEAQQVGMAAKWQ